MNNLVLKRRFEAMLHRLKSQKIELLVQITEGLEDTDTELSELQGLVEDYTQIERSFTTFQQAIGEYIKAKDQFSAPVTQPPVASPATAPLQRDVPDTGIVTAPVSKKFDPSTSEAIVKRKAANKKQTKEATKK